jgi:hypothetical protein
LIPLLNELAKLLPFLSKKRFLRFLVGTDPFPGVLIGGVQIKRRKLSQLLLSPTMMMPSGAIHLPRVVVIEPIFKIVTLHVKT